MKTAFEFLDEVIDTHGSRHASALLCLIDRLDVFYRPPENAAASPAGENDEDNDVNASGNGTSSDSGGSTDDDRSSNEVEKLAFLPLQFSRETPAELKAKGFHYLKELHSIHRSALDKAVSNLCDRL